MQDVGDSCVPTYDLKEIEARIETVLAEKGPRLGKERSLWRSTSGLVASLLSEPQAARVPFRQLLFAI